MLTPPKMPIRSPRMMAATSKRKRLLICVGAVKRMEVAMNTSIYQNIATRTAGDIYIGVVGPVRTGKSTFI